MKKDSKKFQLKFRVSEQEKEEITNYCQERNITISDFLRAAATLLLKEK